MLYQEGLTDTQDPPFTFDMLPDGTPVVRDPQGALSGLRPGSRCGLGVLSARPLRPVGSGGFPDLGNRAVRSSWTGRSAEDCPGRRASPWSVRDRGGGWLRTGRPASVGARTRSEERSRAHARWAVEHSEQDGRRGRGREATRGDRDIAGAKWIRLPRSPGPSLSPGTYKVALELEAGDTWRRGVTRSISSSSSRHSSRAMSSGSVTATLLGHRCRDHRASISTFRAAFGTYRSSSGWSCASSPAGDCGRHLQRSFSNQVTAA